MITASLSGFIFYLVSAAVISAIDLKTRTIPNKILFLFTAGLVLILVLGVLTREVFIPHLLWSILGGVAYFVVFLVLAVVSPSGIGGGDVKLGFLVGLATVFWGGFKALIIGFIVMFVAAGIFAAFLLASKRNKIMPFAPFMFFGSLTAFLLTVQ